MTKAKSIALGGMLAATAIVVMCLGGMIPLATFVCPILCILILQIVTQLTSKRVGWAWYGCVSILCALMAPDKEAAAVFVCLGYYPLIKPLLEKLPLNVLWKLAYFNISIFAMYRALIGLLGMSYLAAEYFQMGGVMLAILMLMGNTCFFLLDLLLSRTKHLIKKR